MLPEDQLEELKMLCPEATVAQETGQDYVLLPNLKLPPGSSPAVVNAVLCPHLHSGYTTRLFLSEQVLGKGNNWNPYQLLDRTWYSPSWQGISADLPLMEMVLGHLEVYR
jgi:hypothetical protein